MKKSRFITFEGTEGAGKSTLIRLVADELQKKGHEVTLTREPGGSAVAEKIRSLILDHPMDPWTELFLYEASRAEHLAQTVRPALTEGRFVLCDRFDDSSLAYQAHARGLDWSKVVQANRLATQGLKPELTVLLDIDPEVGLKRASVQTRFEKEGVAFQAKVREGFLRAQQEDPKRWLVLAVENQSPESLCEQVMKEVQKRGIL